MGSKPMSQARIKELSDLIAELRKQVMTTSQVIGNLEAELKLVTEYSTTDAEMARILSDIQPDIDYAREHGYFERKLV